MLSTAFAHLVAAELPSYKVNIEPEYTIIKQKANESVNFSCHVTPSIHELKNVQIEWMHNGLPIRKYNKIQGCAKTY